MANMLSNLDWQLSNYLREFPARFHYRYTPEAINSLLETLFRSLTADREDLLSLLFPDGPGEGDKAWKLSEAQGTQEGLEYTTAARGHRCGHILKNGEASYHCHTCTDDPTACLCSRCFDASDHEGHTFTLSPSVGNSGCCDCGDDEAWKVSVNCAIHTADPAEVEVAQKTTHLPEELIEAIQITIGRVLDYFCDVISCSPENLRLQKTEEAIKQDEVMSRLSAKYYGSETLADDKPEYALIIWNDEKHTIVDVEEQVKRACRETKQFGARKANEADHYGRSVVKHSRDLGDLLEISKIIEQIKITVTIRSSRDTFREQMCGTIVEWLSDIATCQIDGDSHILRQTICKEMLQLWRVGSQAYNVRVGKHGMDDHGKDDNFWDSRRNVWLGLGQRGGQVVVNLEDGDVDDEDVDPGDARAFDDDEADTGDGMDIDVDQTEESAPVSETDGDWDMVGPAEDQQVGAQTNQEFTPSPARRIRQAGPSNSSLNEAGPSALTPRVDVAGNDSVQLDESTSSNYLNVPKTPARGSRPMPGNLSKHWMTLPQGYQKGKDVPLYEDLSKNLRLDNMILFDLRLWKKTRIDLRDLYISTVVNIPAFKRVLGLRFAGLYTSLASLYLIADREPDHSIINLSLQMLTSQSITDEVIESGNFLTNLMAILYTFLTTRQVGFPKDVNSTATLAFDAGSVNNRRLYHFFTDLRHFLKSDSVQSRVRTQEQYLRQFLDLIKLAQGICPNVRAVGEHVEWETDAWISASLLSREINKLCREFSESFRVRGPQDLPLVSRAISITALTTIVNSVGLERRRFDQAEVKDLLRFKYVVPFDFEFSEQAKRGPVYQFEAGYRAADFTVEQGQVSFHHALHYTLSWLIEAGKSMTREEIRATLDHAAMEFRAKYSSQIPGDLMQSPEDALLAMFDYPLRVCAWLAQMKANMWVRNGLSLRHQMSQYKGVQSRDVAYHRDIFLLQTAFVVCDPSRVLASVIDRFGMDDWMRGAYIVRSAYNEDQLVDILEDFVNLLIVILSDRASLITLEEEPNPQLASVRKDVIHTLCFKPLSYSDLINRLNERVSDLPEFPKILQDLTNYRAPEGLTDSGMFELKPEYLEQLDPYTTNYTKNQRDEAENIYKNWMSKKLHKSPADIVPEPKLRPIQHGTFIHLTDFTKVPLFAQIVYYALGFTLQAQEVMPNVPVTRLEAFLQVILQLVLIAAIEDLSEENASDDPPPGSFIRMALTTFARHPLSENVPTIMSVLQQISLREEYVACRPKIKHILRIFCRKYPKDFEQATSRMNLPYDRLDTSSPANVENDVETKKRQALERQKRVMAQFQQQQQNFMQNQGFNDWGDADLSDEEMDLPESTESKVWKYPSGVCILCQEETNDSRLYGTFAMISKSNILRTTDLDDPDYVREALRTPQSLDRSAEEIRPFGVAGENHHQVRVLDTQHRELLKDRQGLGRGFPKGQSLPGPVSIGCGHIMHYACFENYCSATNRRQHQQIARHHPESLQHREFVCPLCKALGNAFLPIIWKGKEESYPGVVASKVSFDRFLLTDMPESSRKLSLARENILDDPRYNLSPSKIYRGYITSSFGPDLVKDIGAPQSTVSSPVSPTSLPSLRFHMPGGFPVLTRGSAEDLPRVLPAAPVGVPVSPPPLSELQRIYHRLRETIKFNFTPWPQLRADRSMLEGTFHNFWTLATTYGYSISAVEIAHRGVQSDVGMTLLDRISQQSLTHLRILSETAFSFVASAQVEPTRRDNYSPQMYHLLSMMFFEMFPTYQGHYQPISGFKTSLLSTDVFTALAEKSLILCPIFDIDIHHIVRLCYIAEILKVFLAYLDEPEGLQQAALRLDLSEEGLAPHEDSFEVHRIQGMMKWIALTVGLDQWHRKYGTDPEFPAEQAILMQRLARHYALPFLRKVTILFHTRYGVQFPSLGLSDIETPELDRLTRLLRLPTVDDIISIFQFQFAENAEHEKIRELAGYWIHKHLAEVLGQQDSPGPAARSRNKDHDTRLDIRLPHPGILELVGLPKYYDVLMEEAQKRKCPTTGKDLTDPSVCLFCGDIFCSQAKCCMGTSYKGGCTQHLAKCSAPIGLFLNIRKCMILVMHGQNGSWLTAPYLTKHGEVDPGLRQHHQLILSQKRYDKLLREVWLNHGIASIISRKLEGDINTGGWETI